MKKLLSGVIVFAVFLLMSCQQPETEAENAGDQQLMDSLMTAYETAWENEDAAAFDDILAAGFTRTVNNAEAYGIDSLKQMATGGGDLQNLSIDIVETIYGDNNAAVSWTLDGTLGGQSITTAGASFVIFEGGMIASERVIMDTAPMVQAMMQLGEEGGAAADTSSM